MSCQRTVGGSGGILTANPDTCLTTNMNDTTGERTRSTSTLSQKLKDLMPPLKVRGDTHKIIGHLASSYLSVPRQLDTVVQYVQGLCLEPNKTTSYDTNLLTLHL